MAAFSKRHYELIAAQVNRVAARYNLEPVTLTERESVLLELVRELDSAFASDNPRYDSNRFWDAAYHWMDPA